MVLFRDHLPDLMFLQNGVSEGSLDGVDFNSWGFW